MQMISLKIIPPPKFLFLNGLYVKDWINIYCVFQISLIVLNG